MAFENPENIDTLLAKYHRHRIPPLNELVDEKIIEAIYRGYTELHGMAMMIRWPVGDPRELSSWGPLAGIDYLQIYRPFCKACTSYRSPSGDCPLEDRCRSWQARSAWEAAKRAECITAVCENGLINILYPVILESRVIAILVTGQLVPVEGSVWDTSSIEGVEEKGREVDLRKICLDRMNACRESAPDCDFPELSRGDGQHREVQQADLARFERGLSDARDILVELAGMKVRLDKQIIRSYFREQLLEAPLERGPFWAFLDDWFANWELPDTNFVLGMTYSPDDEDAVTVTMNRGLPGLSLGRHVIRATSVWNELLRIDRDAPATRAFRLKHLLKGCDLPASKALVVPLGRQGFLTYGFHDRPEGPALWEDEQRAIAQLGRDISLLIGHMGLSHAKDEFLTYFSHELRAPIHSADFTIDRLRKGRLRDDPTVFDETCRRLQAQLGRLLKLIEGVWHRQKILAGRATYQASRTNLFDFLTHCASQARDMTDRDDLTIIADQQSLAKLRAVELDRHSFELVVFNLLDNAIKYSAKGSEIRVYGRQTGYEVVLTFTNVGLRIPPRSELDIFARFTRTREAMCVAPESAGIGLFLVKHIVEGHGGRVTAVSEPHGPHNHLVKVEIRLPNKQ